MKRALFVVITDDLGGAERIAFGLAAELQSRGGWAVEVMTAAARLPNSAGGALLPAAVQLRYGPSTNFSLALLTLPARLLNRRFDLVFSTQAYTNGLVSMLRRLRLLRIGRLVMRESAAIFDAYADASAARKSLLRWLYRRYGSEDLLIAQTGYMADHVRAYVPAKTAAHLRVLPNPVDLAAIERGVQAPIEPELSRWIEQRPTILFCGRAIALKQPQLALAAFAELVRRGCDAQLVFVGGGPLEADVVEACEKLGLSNRVRFLGRLINPYPVIAACRYGLVTSSREGFPNVILEMMACGQRTVVTTPCAGDLDKLAGVRVTSSFEPADIADHLWHAIHSGEDHSQVYKAEVRNRSISVYLDTILQTPASRHRSQDASGELGRECSKA